MRQCEGVLLPDIVLPFDDPEFAGCTVGDVLADPDRFDGATLADPLEGVEYGTCKAKIMRRADGTLWIHTFAHGRTIYELKLDAAAVRAAMERADRRTSSRRSSSWPWLPTSMTASSSNCATWQSKASGVGRRAIDALAQDGADEEGRPARRRSAAPPTAERQRPAPVDRGPGPRRAVAAAGARIINEVLGAVRGIRTATRDIDGTVTRARASSRCRTCTPSRRRGQCREDAMTSCRRPNNGCCRG